MKKIISYYSNITLNQLWRIKFNWADPNDSKSLSPLIDNFYDKIKFYNINQAAWFLKRTISFLRLHSTQNPWPSVLFCSGNKTLLPLMRKLAMSCDQLYLNTLWFSGILSNWQLNSVLISLPTKKRKKIHKKSLYLQSSYPNFNWKPYYKKIPSLFIFIPFIEEDKKRSSFIKEAKKILLPTVAVTNLKYSLENILYPIPCNTSSLEALITTGRLISLSLRAGKASIYDFKKLQQVELIKWTFMFLIINA